MNHILTDNLDEFYVELQYAYDNVPFYKKHLDKAGIDPEQLSEPEDLEKVPTTEKRDYRKNFPLGTFARGYSLKDPRLVRSQSSGTTGERLITYEAGMLLTSRAMECVEINEAIEEAFAKPERRICRYAPPNCSDVECANPNSSMQDRMLEDGTLVLPVYHDLLTTSENMIKRALDEIIEYQPDLYYVDPNHFAFLLRYATRLNVAIPAAPIVATYSPFTPLCRKQILDYFARQGEADVALAQLVSSSEMGWIALECPEGNLHLNCEAFHMEIQTQTGEENLGELCISSIDNGAVPHIRYQTGDIFSLRSEPCSCGLDTPLVRMEGRKSSFLKVNGRQHSVNDMADVIGSPVWLDMYQLQQEHNLDFTLALIVNEHYREGQEAELLCALQSLLGPQSRIQVGKVPYIATERSGKFSILKINND